VRFLTPTGNKRLNELIGFLCLVLAVLIAGALFSYSPRDASWNVAAPAVEGGAPANWIGPVGAYCSDAIFQLLGYSAFLLPMAILWLGIKWFRSRAVNSPKATLLGYVLLLMFLPALFTLANVWDVRGAIPAGGMLGKLMAGLLIAGLNKWGAVIVTLALLVTATFLTTTFSFGGAHAWASGPKGPIGAVGKLGILQRAQAKWQDWRASREQERMRRRVEANRLGGRKPVGNTSISGEGSQSIQLADESDIFKGTADEEDDEEETAKGTKSKTPILFLNQDKPEKAPKKTTEAKIAKNANYKLPSVSLLREGDRAQKLDEDELKERARAIEEKCQEFDVQGRVTQINPGPVVTTIEFKPEAGIKYSRIIGLTEDLCLALKAESILIERIPGKSTIGIEVPNANRETIALREIIEAQEFVGSASKLTLAMGRDLHGRIRVTDLASMPHLLIAGSTGTGKSVFINSLLMSILYKATPDDVKIVLVDPKRLELNLYEGIPHLIAPVVTDPKIASNVLRNATREMENRLKLLAQKGVRNIDQYNRTFQKTQSLSLFDNLEETEHKPLPYLVIIIDELADLMMVDTNNVEESITRLAQMARAVGI
ncbi:MAG TPA: DNA translocase FtsK 4TM domain-containing protein, partial [Candidatus Acidoferrum sp.]